MNMHSLRKIIPAILASFALSGCATTEALVDAPTVTLNSVELESISFGQQTFLLGFDVHNPNAFPLPVRAVRYRVLFDDERFAGGQARGAFMIPANGDGQFALDVDLDIANSASMVTSLLAGGVPDYVRYRIEGSLTVDIPYARPLPFSSSGVINVRR